MPSDQTFDTFVRHWTNDYAYGVARHLVSRSCTNPFIIFRGRECGKTHLLSAIAHELRRQELSITIVHTSKAWINCLPRSRVDKAVEELRDAEVILIDGIDEIDMFDSSLQPYVSCLLDRIESGCTVIGTIQDSPVGVRDTADTRLVSTIAQAIICSIQSPNNELRALIVRQRLQTLGCNGVDEPVIDFLANHVSAAHSIREVMGATNTVAARFGAELKHVPLNELRELIRTNFDLFGEHKVAVQHIQTVVAEYYGLKQADMLSPRRARVVARPRQIAMWLCKQITTRSLPDLGRRFGGRDHTTVIHAIRKIEDLRGTDPGIKNDSDKLLARLKHR